VGESTYSLRLSHHGSIERKFNESLPGSTDELAFRKRVNVFDTTKAYVDGDGVDPVVYLQGNPMPSYL
jgi:hypothetical protein